MSALILVPKPRSHVPAESIPLKESYLCVDCEVVMRVDKSRRCIVCASDSVLPMYRVLGNREPSSHTSLPHTIERLLSSIENADEGDPREWWESIRAQVRAIREESQ